MRTDTGTPMANIFASLPCDLDEEMIQDLVTHENARIHRIISKGHSSPETGWYDQEENEWVIVLQGAGTVLFENGAEVKLARGDYLDIPAHARHRVSWTSPDEITVWLAIFYK